MTRGRRLFQLPYTPEAIDLDRPYDVTADGERFLISAPLDRRRPDGFTRINVPVGWPSRLPQRTGSDPASLGAGAR